MRRLTKQEKPQILFDKELDWLTEYKGDSGNNIKKYRYRHPDIKEALRKETGWKCIYCESKIGHNTPGDVDHKIPSSKVPDLHFAWDNLTVACTECNRRKSDAYHPNDPFLDPYMDDVENIVLHHGPIVSWLPGDTKAEKAIRILELDSESRLQLFLRKLEKMRSVANLLSRIENEGDESLRGLMQLELERMQSAESEFSALVLSTVDACRRRRAMVAGNRAELAATDPL